VRSKHHVNIILIFSIILILSVSLLAQEKESLFKNQPVVELSSDIDSKITLARRLMRAFDFQTAADLLEPLYEKNQSNSMVHSLLKSCYMQTKQFGRVETFLRMEIKRQPERIGNYLSLAEIIARQGRTEEAIKEYDKVINLPGMNQKSRFLLLFRSMISVGLEDHALVKIDQLREDNDDSTMFGLERGTILEKQIRYTEAALEYLPYLKVDTSANAVQAEKKLLALLEFQDSSEEIIKLLTNQKEYGNSLRIIKLLADYYLKNGDSKQAFDLSVKFDSLGNTEGSALVHFVRQGRDRQAWTQVVAMTDYTLQKYPGNPFEIDLRFTKGEALAEISETDKAIEAYNKIYSLVPNEQIKADALYQLGSLHFYYLNDYQKALIYFDSIVVTHPRGTAYQNARRLIPHCYLRTGQLDLARMTFEAQITDKMIDGIKEEVLYNLAVISLFEKDYKNANQAFRKLLVDYPRGLYNNDALSMVLLIDAAEGEDSLLHNISDVLFLEAQGMIDSTLIMYQQVIDQPGSKLADIALYNIILIELNRDEIKTVRENLEILISGYPDSYYYPLGLKIKADMIIEYEDNIEEGMIIYRKLLEEFSDYPFTSEIRDKLRELDAALVG